MCVLMCLCRNFGVRLELTFGFGVVYPKQQTTTFPPYDQQCSHCDIVLIQLNQQSPPPLILVWTAS